MKYRIAGWASAGFLVAGSWAVYFAEAFLTQPIALASFHLHFGIGVYWVPLANIATYALVGLIVETLRRKLNQAK